MQNNRFSKENEQRILDEAWEIIYEAIAKGHIKEACERIHNITGVSETEAMEIIEYLRTDIPNSDYVAPYGIPNATNSSEWKPIRTQGAYTKKSTIQKVVGKNDSLVLCIMCSTSISPLAESCPHCGHPTGVHVCPKCNSTNTKVISGSSKATSIFLWGPFAANKVLSQFQCKDCGHKW